MGKSFGNRVCPLAFLALLAFSDGARGHEGAHENPETAATPVREIGIRGRLAYSDGAPVSGQPAQYQWIVEGSDLFSGGTGTCPATARHMTGTRIESRPSGERGEYDLRLEPDRIQSVAAPSCRVSDLKLGQLQQVRLRATILATPDSCRKFCSARGDATEACARDCSSGQRILEGTTTISRAELEAAAADFARGRAEFKRPLAVTRLGPPLSETLGVDLRMDSQAAGNSILQVEERVAPDDCAIRQGCVRGPGARKLLRFDGVIENVGSSDLHIGDPVNNGLFEVDACHGHSHLKNMVTHRLLHRGSLDPVRSEGDEVVSYKQGFCLMDTAQIAATTAEGRYTCEDQGISAGWSDIYSRELDCQYLDVTGVAPGDYVLRLIVDPSGIFEDSDPSNNSSDIPVTVR